MEQEQYLTLLNHYDVYRAYDALIWFRLNHSKEFRKSLSNQAKYCINNEYLWWVCKN